jgi:hypothetical protein
MRIVLRSIFVLFGQLLVLSHRRSVQRLTFQAPVLNMLLNSKHVTVLIFNVLTALGWGSPSRS